MGNSASSGPAQQPPPPCAATAAADEGACPVNPRYKNAAVYNVYGQRINDPNSPLAQSPLASITGTSVLDPKNNMPLEPNQLPCPGQRKPLSVDRVASNIPKGGTDSTWVYPSPQMVFNGACPLSPSPAPPHPLGGWRARSGEVVVGGEPGMLPSWGQQAIEHHGGGDMHAMLGRQPVQGGMAKEGGEGGCGRPAAAGHKRLQPPMHVCSRLSPWHLSTRSSQAQGQG